MGSRSDLRGRQERLGKARARKPRRSGAGPRNTLPAIALSASPAGPDNARVSVAFRACDALRCIRNRQSSRWTGPNHGPPRLEQGAEKAVRPPAGNIFPTRGRDCPFGREQETHCVSPAGAGRFPVDRQVQAQQRPAPDPAGEKRPPGAGRALAGGFGPPAGLGSAWRCGRGDGPCHCSGERAFIGAGGTRKCTAFPPPVRDSSPQIGRSRHTAGQRPTRRAGSARRGRGGRWPGALGPRRAKGQRGTVAGAMAPAIEAVKGLSSLRAGKRTAFPRPCGTVPPSRVLK
jgi:hypothetical protein